MADRSSDILTARWTAVPNDEIGGWAVSPNGQGPLNGGPMAADMVWSQEIAEHIADLHNQWHAQRFVTVRPATAVVRGERHQATPLTAPAIPATACPSQQPWICTPQDCPGCFNPHCWVIDGRTCRNGCDVKPRTSPQTNAEETS
ncbi:MULTISPECIES: hypothetical protein [unclassified Micromonospora]|uniref:hypothetical protein n=1 Tax=unclassified Micromonospora TaxID=2617518 RepID=UPI00332A17EE